MSDELFERYLRHDLDEPGARKLGALLDTKEGAEAFRDFVLEWTLLGEAARQRVVEAGLVGTRKIRKRSAATKPCSKTPRCAFTPVKKPHWSAPTASARPAFFYCCRRACK